MRGPAILPILLVMLSACPSRGIGDPCTPEVVPEGGYRDTEVIVESSSVQCRTRTCMVFQLDGDPRLDCEELDDPRCVESRGASSVQSPRSEARIFCTCRCRWANGEEVQGCRCGEGFHCVDVTPRGGDGFAGAYCVPDDLCTRDEDCPSRVCLTSNGTCAPGSAS